MRQRLQKFISGRYGGDQFSRFLVILAWALIVLSLFVSGTAGRLVRILVSVDLVYSMYRCLSRNIPARNNENLKYLQIKEKLISGVKNTSIMAKQGRDYRFFRCPNCNVMTRVPRGKGRIKIICPKCRTEFIRKS